MMAFVNISCVNTTKQNSQTADISDVTEVNSYIDNRLQTGDTPYLNAQLSGSESTIQVRTSTKSEYDIVAIVKHNNIIVRNAYIVAGESYTFHVPNGFYQVFFYGGKGWNPDKTMRDGVSGGFVADESFSKDSEVSLNYQGLEYELIPQPNGNFSTLQSNASEMF